MQIKTQAPALLLLAACNPGVFEGYLDDAPIRVQEPPGDFDDPRYGQVTVVLNGSLDGRSVGRIVSSGGGGTPMVFTRAWDDGEISEKTFLRCKDESECSEGRDIGETMIPLDVWGADTPQPRNLCVFAPSNAVRSLSLEDPRPGGEGYVACEYPTNRPQNFDLGQDIRDARAEVQTLRFSGFALPNEHPLGVVMYGAYAIENRTSVPSGGAVYVLPDMTHDGVEYRVLPSRRLELIDPTTGAPFSDAEDAADLGKQVVGAPWGDTLVFAVAQPSKQRVIVGSYDDALPGDVQARVKVHACIPTPEPGLSGFGEQLAMGDLTGDGEPELVIGVDPLRGAELGRQALFVYDGRGLPDAVGGDECPGWNEEPTPVPCRDRGELACADSGFGASLAIGDVDADGAGDLIVGAPLTEVAGRSEVGAVWIVPGSADGLDAERTVVVTVPSQVRARFGWNVGALRTRERDEPVASAPGVSEVYTVMCTELESGFGGSSLCLD